MSGFRKATKKKKKLVLSFQGASGAGKTFSALSVASHICPAGKRVGFIDTEQSADLYGDIFDFDVDSDFGPFGKLNYGPNEWMKKLQAAAQEKGADGECTYGVLVLDSLTHMWKGRGGILAQLDDDANAYKAKTGKFADTNALWKKFDPMYTKFMNDLRQLPFHVIFCLRAKQKTDRKTNERGKTEITKLGLEAEFRDGFDYDVDAQFLVDEDHIMVAKKHRLGAHLNGKVFENPGKNLADVLLDWLENGVEAAPEAAPTPPPEPSPDTTRIPDTESHEHVPQPKAVVTKLDELLAQINAAQTLGDLKVVGEAIKVALSNKEITPEERNGPLTAAYAARQKALKVAA